MENGLIIYRRATERNLVKTAGNTSVTFMRGRRKAGGDFNGLITTITKGNSETATSVAVENFIWNLKVTTTTVSGLRIRGTAKERKSFQAEVFSKVISEMTYDKDLASGPKKMVPKPNSSIELENNCLSDSSNFITGLGSCFNVRNLPALKFCPRVQPNFALSLPHLICWHVSGPDWIDLLQSFA